MIAPRPDAIRLWTRATLSPLPSPPLGLRSWSREAAAVAVLLDASINDLANLAAVAAQIPNAETLGPATLVMVLGEAVNARRGWGRLFGVGRSKIARALRCGALLVQGYVDIGAALDPATGSDIVWGWSSRT